MKEYFKLSSGVFIDIGANIGKYSVKLGRELGSRGKVIAIEPEKRNFNILMRNIELNSLKNVLAFKVACSNKNKEVNLYLRNYNLDNTGHSIKGSVGWPFEKVGCERLDSLVERLGLSRVDLIKIDVEGAEVEVLEGALKTLKKYKPNIICEIKEDNFSKVKQILNHLGYKLKKIDGENHYAYFKEG